jgi:hypothetical protein
MLISMRSIGGRLLMEAVGNSTPTVDKPHHMPTARKPCKSPHYGRCGRCGRYFDGSCVVYRCMILSASSPDEQSAFKAALNVVVADERALKAQRA